MEAPSRSLQVSGFSTPLRVFIVARGFFALVGLALLVAVAAPGGTPATDEPEDAAPVQARLTTGPATRSSHPASQRIEIVARVREREQRAVVEFISRRYRVAEEAIASFVSSAYRAGAEHRVDPLLILAVVAIESRFNPVAESLLGAKGLMQVLPKYHQDKLFEHGGEPALLDPEINIRVGTQILREYLGRFGEIETALQVYAGALDEPNSQYASKVLAVRARLEQLIARARHSAA